MLEFLLLYLGGMLTIVSPCILPVLPFVFARSDGAFVYNGLPLLVGMALTFAVVAGLAAVAGAWAVTANEYGRTIALVCFALFGAALLFPRLAQLLTRPLAGLGAAFAGNVEKAHAPHQSTMLRSFLLGIATGLLWTPCAGPLLGLVLAGAAVRGASVETSLLLFAYAAGAATSLALALLAGGRVFALMKRSLGAGEWVKRGLGATVLIAVAAIALGLDSGLLARLSAANTASLEEALIDRFGGPGRNSGVDEASGAQRKDPRIGADLPSLAGAVAWLNSPPLTNASLKGKVVLIDFWTYSCINCLRTIPYVRAWAEKYRDQGLVVIGVHAPEFAFEKNIDNVRGAVAELKIGYPVAVDNEYAIWRAFNNRHWPAHYFVDASGRIRHFRFGEGHYEQSEQVIQSLLAEAGARGVSTGTVTVNAAGVEAAANWSGVGSPETYIGYDRAENFVSPGGIAEDVQRAYTASPGRLNEWGLYGSWTVRSEHAALGEAGGGIRYRFRARDLHLVLAPTQGKKSVRFVITIDGDPPGNDHGLDADAEGRGIVTGQRLYQLVRQRGAATERTFEIRFLDPGVQAYAFTFG